MSQLKENLAELYKLQLIDNEILENLRQLKRIKDAESETAKKYQDLLDSKAKIDEQIKPIKDAANQIKDENAKHAEKKMNCEDRLFNADTDPRDLQYLQKEREQFINLIKKNEDELVRLMVQVDNEEIKKNDLDEKIKELEPEYAEEKKKNEETLKTLNARIDELKKERHKFNDFEDKSLLSLYQKLQRENDGLAIVTVSDGVCEGCFVEVSKSTMIQLDESEDIVTCQRCGRIIFDPGAVSTVE